MKNIKNIKNKKLSFIGLVLYLLPLFNDANNSYIFKNSKEAVLAMEESRELSRKKEAIYKFLRSYNSPVATKADTFVQVSVENDLDWTLLVSIAGVESTFGKNVLYNSHNPFGWGKGYIYFESWEDSIKAVGRGLADYKKKYNADTIEEIAPIYCPPNYKKWIWGVKYFSEKLREQEKNHTSKPSITT